ncbi:MAG: phosphate ABC transporter substrate-binding protein [Oscillospiraceae bacterium]|nr:phosphate ABC transporter substrate-binding protein [Oscillospiraceae bacterium]
MALLMLSALFLSGCRPEHSVVIAGSTSVLPYAEILAEAYAHLHAADEIDVQGGGSSAGITAAESGAADIGMSSRSLKESEKHLWSIEIAKDGLAVIVHPGNPVADLTLEQVRAVFAREITSWSQVGGADYDINVIAREEGSGSRSAFEDLVMGESKISPRAIVQASNGAVRQLVSGDKNAIGFISLGLVEEGEKPVKALRLGGVEAARENVVNGTYSLFRPFLFVCAREPEGDAMAFVEFALSPEGRRILEAEGLVTGPSTTPEPTTVPFITDPNFDYIGLFKRLEGVWNVIRPYADNEYNYFFYRNGEPNLFVGYYESEGSDFGTLIGGRSKGENTAQLIFMIPAVSEEPERPPGWIEIVSVDFNSLDSDNEIGIQFENYPREGENWRTFAYAGATFEEAWDVYANARGYTN